MSLSHHTSVLSVDLARAISENGLGNHICLRLYYSIEFPFVLGIPFLSSQYTIAGFRMLICTVAMQLAVMCD